MQLFLKGDDIEDIGQELVNLNNEETGSTMREIFEDKSFGSARRCTYLSKYWVDEYITEMEIQGYTSLAHFDKGLFDTSFIGKYCEQEEQSKMHDICKRIAIEEVGQVLYVHQEDHTVPLLEKGSILEEVDKFAPLGPANKYVDPTMDWEDKYIF